MMVTLLVFSAACWVLSISTMRFWLPGLYDSKFSYGLHPYLASLVVTLLSPLVILAAAFMVIWLTMCAVAMYKFNNKEADEWQEPPPY